MIVTLDGQRVEGGFSPECTLQAIIEQVRENAGVEDRLIVSVTVNGERLDEETLNASLQQPVAADAQIDLESSDAAELVSSALLALSQQFAEAATKLPEVAGRLVGGEGPAAICQIGEFVNLWQTCYRAITQCSGLLGQDLTTYEHAGEPISARLEEVVHKLTDLRGALESRDVVLLADLLRYELTPLAELWQRLLSGLAERVGGCDGST